MISRREFLKFLHTACAGALASAVLPQGGPPVGDLPAPVVIYYGSRELDHVAMTFDDCYDLNLLQQWADFLQEFPKTRMTFFPVGLALENAAAKKPDLWKNLIAQGHEIGYHGYNHAMPSSLSVSAALEDYKKWLAAAVKAVDTEPQVHFARPPFGELSYSFLNMCKQNNLMAAMWTDSWGMADVFFEKEKELSQKGDIILFHIRFQDLENARVALPYFLGRGLGPVTLTELYTLGRQSSNGQPACLPNPRKVCPR